MTTALIPYSPGFTGLDPTRLEFQKETYRKNRKSILNELRNFSGVPEIAGKLNQETLYRIVAAPEGGKLYKDVAGNLKGVFYEKGKIIEHAKLKAFTPSLLKAATAIGSQILLVSIAMQLNRIEKGIVRIVTEFHNDRISEIISGANLFTQAMKSYGDTNQVGLILLAIQNLNTGLEKTIRSLKEQINDAPEPENSFFENWGCCKTKNAEEAMNVAEESFCIALFGIKTLSECLLF